MGRKNWKLRKAILPLLLSAVMVAEPVGTTMIYAKEGEPATVQTQETAVVTDEELPAGAEQPKEDIVVAPVQEEENDGQASEEDGTDKEGETDTPSADETDKKDVPSGSGEETGDSGQKEDTDGTDEEEKPSEAEAGDEQEVNPDEEEAQPEGEEPEEEASEEEEMEGELPDEEEVSEEEEDALDGFKGMPASYSLTSDQMESKRSLAAYVGEDGELPKDVSYVEGEVVLLVDSREEAEQIAEAYNAEIKTYEYGVLTLKLGEKDTVQKALKAAANPKLNMPAVWPNYRRYLHEDVEPENITVSSENGLELETAEYEAAQDYAGADYTAAVTDPLAVDSSQYQYQWHHTTVGSTYAWAEGYTGKGVTVAVLDSGVVAHNDLDTVNVIYGGDKDINVNHGTHVAGIIGAKANGSLGVGIAPDVTMLSGNLGDIESNDIMAAIRAAVQNNADLINMSIGGLGYSGSEQSVINEAYNAGIAIFASAGNDGGQTYSYPACYDHVISVAATDKNNERASFSTYNNKVDLSAPGVEIWSTDKDNASGYLSMQGTSMACPVATGEAAVLLCSHADLKDMSKGSKRVDKLEEIMKKNAVKAGSGMGAGITSLTKALGLSTATAKPVVPNITIVPDDKSKAQKVTVTIKAQAGTTIYFTKNGKNPSFKNGVADAKTETEQYSAPFEIKDRAKATIKAIAVNENGVSSAVKSVSYTMSPYVTGIEISGVQQVAVGKNIQLTAEVTPAYAENKNLTWELQNTDGTPLSGDLKTKLKVSTSGKVTADKKMAPGSYKVVATAKDDKKVSAEYTIEVISGVRVKSVKLLKEKSGNAALSALTLKLPTMKTYDFAQNLVPEAMGEGVQLSVADFKWTSSNKAVAAVNDKGVLTLKKAGKATITAIANDSSGKKATCKVTVVQLATDIKLTGPKTVAAGKGVTFKASAAPSDVTNKKVTWELYKGEKKIDKNDAKTVGVSISAAGKVTAAKTAQTGEYTVKAVAADGGGANASAVVTVKSGGITGFAFETKADKTVTLFRKAARQTTQIKKEVFIKTTMSGDADPEAFEVTNSNPGIAACEATQTSGRIKLAITATGRAAGQTKITVKSTDGSNKSLTCTVKVVNPATAIYISPKAGGNGCLVRGKSLQLKASVQAERGTLSNKNVTWELYTTGGTKIDKKMGKSLGVSISTSGKVSAKKNATLDQSIQDAPVGYAEYIVKATAKDGSGVYATYPVSLTEGTKGQFSVSVLGSQQIIKTGVTYKVFAGDSLGFVVRANDLYQGGFTVSSSNPSVISVGYDGMSANQGIMYMAVYKKGSASITIKAMDGSGKQRKINFTVK